MSTLTSDTGPLWDGARRTWPDLPWERAVLTHGAFHHVAVLAGDAVVRVAAGAGWAAVRDGFATALEGLAAVDATTLGGARALRPVRAWCGGDAWPDVVERITWPWDGDLRSRALALVGEVTAAGTGADLSVVHGDLSPFNLHLDSRSLVGLIDLDHACVADPAIDVAGVVAAYGADTAREVAADDVVARAVLHRAALPLQVAAAAEFAQDPGLRDHALHRATRHLDPRP